MFEEKLETAPEAFRALVLAAVQDGAAVIIPGLEHLAIHGHAISIKEVLASAIGRDVLLASRTEGAAITHQSKGSQS